MKTSLWFRVAPVVMVLAAATAAAQDSSATPAAQTPIATVTTPAEASSTSPLVPRYSCGLYDYGRNGSPAHGGVNADGYR